eukprot:scaffold61743_cov75-Phaeocystis_antarctica.AAC.1
MRAHAARAGRRRRRPRQRPRRCRTRTPAAPAQQTRACSAAAACHASPPAPAAAALTGPSGAPGLPHPAGQPAAHRCQGQHASAAHLRSADVASERKVPDGAILIARAAAVRMRERTLRRRLTVPAVVRVAHARGVERRSARTRGNFARYGATIAHVWFLSWQLLLLRGAPRGRGRGLVQHAAIAPCPSAREIAAKSVRTAA